MKYRVVFEDASEEWVEGHEFDRINYLDCVLYIEREDQRRVPPKEVHERATELWVGEGAPGDELPEGRHYRRAIAELEAEQGVPNGAG